jgi:hypothetical protein
MNDAAARRITPGGTFYATVRQEAWTGTEDDWHGAPMYWSHGTARRTHRGRPGAGSGSTGSRVPEGDGGHAALLATSLTGVGERR